MEDKSWLGYIAADRWKLDPNISLLPKQLPFSQKTPNKQKQQNMMKIQQQ